MQSVTPVLGWGSVSALDFPTIRKGWKDLSDHFIPHNRNNYHPHILSHRLLALFSLLLLSVKVATIGALSLGSLANPAYSSAITSSTIISLTNQSRTEQQMSSLTANAQLASAAQAKANDMAAKGYFSHTTPDGKSPWDFIKATRYRYLSAGENLAVDFNQAESVQSAWMNSPGHRANILNKDFREIGIGIASGTFQGHEATFVVQMFAQPINSNVVIQDKPTVVAVASTPASVPVAAGEPVITITDVSTQVISGDLQVNLAAPPNVVKVLAQYGDQAIMLEPKSDNRWAGSVPLTDLADQNLRVIVSDISGRIVWQNVGSFVANWQNSYNLNGEVQGEAVKLFGIVIQPKLLEQKFYLLFIAAILACLMVAIGVRRHVQHLSMIANASFVAMVACLLWLAG